MSSSPGLCLDVDRGQQQQKERKSVTAISHPTRSRFPLTSRPRALALEWRRNRGGGGSTGRGTPRSLCPPGLPAPSSQGSHGPCSPEQRSKEQPSKVTGSSTASPCVKVCATVEYSAAHWKGSRASKTTKSSPYVTSTVKSPSQSHTLPYPPKRPVSP